MKKILILLVVFTFMQCEIKIDTQGASASNKSTYKSYETGISNTTLRTVKFEENNMEFISIIQSNGGIETINLTKEALEIKWLKVQINRNKNSFLD